MKTLRCLAVCLGFVLLGSFASADDTRKAPAAPEKAATAPKATATATAKTGMCCVPKARGPIAAGVLCKNCTGKLLGCEPVRGKCSECAAVTLRDVYKLCNNCSTKSGKCRRCKVLCATPGVEQCSKCKCGTRCMCAWVGACQMKLTPCNSGCKCESVAAPAKPRVTSGPVTAKTTITRVIDLGKPVRHQMVMHVGERIRFQNGPASTVAAKDIAGKNVLEAVFSQDKLFVAKNAGESQLTVTFTVQAPGHKPMRPVKIEVTVKN